LEAVAVDSTDPAGMLSVDILGSRLDLLTPVEVRRWLRRALADPWEGRCRHIVTLNPEYVMASRRNPKFSSALTRADLSTADGVGVSVAAKAIHHKRVTRLTGVELTEWLAKESTLFSPLFLLGAGPGIAEAAAQQLLHRCPGAVISGTWGGGSHSAVDDTETIRRIRESGAKMVAVAYGAPGQIIWIDRNRPQLQEIGVRVVIGIGGALDYLSGIAWRPPQWVRQIGLEWLVRLVREPARWRRQLVLPLFAALLLRETIRNRFF